MSVRVVTEAPQTPKRGRGPWILAAIGLAVALIAVLVQLIGKPATPPAPTSTPTVDGSSSATVQPSATTSVPETAPAPTMGVLGTVVDGLWRGTATVATGSTDVIFGVPIGWDRTVDGAVAAAMHTSAAFYALPSVVEDTAAELNPHLYTGTALDDMLTGETMVAFRAQLRKICRLSDEGVVVDANGNPSTEERYLGGGIPEYGAYQVRDVESSNGAVTRVEVAVFQPVYSGPATDTNTTEVLLMFRKSVYVMTWTDGDWKVADWGELDEPKGPWEVAYSNQGFEWIRQQIGPGWAVPADATEDPLPGAVMTR